jgi:hypothetical protein
MSNLNKIMYCSVHTDPATSRGNFEAFAPQNNFSPIGAAIFDQPKGLLRKLAKGTVLSP